MVLQRVTIKNIKKFLDETVIKLEDDFAINSISGTNGSGKSTIFECITLCQKAYFIDLIQENSNYDDELLNVFDTEKLYKDFAFELDDLVSDKRSASSIQMDMKMSYEELGACKTSAKIYDAQLDERGSRFYEFSVKVTLEKNKIWRIDLDEKGNDGIVGEFWNLSNPSNIIVYLNADKNVYEDDFTYQKINMISDDLVNPVIQFVLNPKGIYQDMYNIMLNAYVYQRLNPLKNARNSFFSDAQKMFSELIKSKEISNVSGKEKVQQFTLMASVDKKKYDARNLSSGEKLIWYSCLFLNYIKSIGILVIDEPENHLHEKLAWQYIQFLEGICYGDYSGLHIGQVFLITHSKNIIYNNFASGKNYVIMPDGSFHVVKKEECEDILRMCGISYIDDNVLFVEGTTEIGLLEEICKAKNIKVRELSNCSEIEQVYTSLVKVKGFVYAPKISFMIDKDTKGEEEIQQLRNADKAFFDKNFIILPVHEIENLLLDVTVICEEYNKLAANFEKSILKKDDIEQQMRKIADSTLQDTKKKYINYELRKNVVRIGGLVKKKEVEVTSKEKYDEYIDSLYSGIKFQQYIKDTKSIYESMEKIYGGDNWDNHWIELCDGKVVFNRLIAELSHEVGVSQENLRKKIVDASKQNTKSKLMKFVPLIYKNFSD